MSDTASDARYGKTRISKIKAAVDNLRSAIRSSGTPEIQDAWDRFEPWVDVVFGRPATSPEESEVDRPAAPARTR